MFQSFLNTLNIFHMSSIKQAQDEVLVSGEEHYPCVIYFRERGKAIGKVGTNMRKERQEWSEQHKPWEDNICSLQCLDFCRLYNERWETFHSGLTTRSGRSAS